MNIVIIFQEHIYPPQFKSIYFSGIKLFFSPHVKPCYFLRISTASFHFKQNRMGAKSPGPPKFSRKQGKHAF